MELHYDRDEDMQILVPSSNQQLHALFINRSHLLSAIYVTEFRGKLLPLYGFLQQMEIGLNLVPFKSILELKKCLAEANGSFVVEDLVIKQAQGNLNATPSYAIEAVPISYIAPEVNPDEDDQVDHDGMENVTLSIQNKRKGLRWLKNWYVRPRQRPNGRIDKYYYHKQTNVMCRSLSEVDRYELHGIRPKRAPKVKQETGNENLSAQGSSKDLLKRKRICEDILDNYYRNQQNVEMSLSSNNVAAADNPELKRRVEKFFQEAYQNQINLSKDSSEQPEHGKENAEIKESSPEEEEGGESSSSLDPSQPLFSPQWECDYLEFTEASIDFDF